MSSALDRRLGRIEAAMGGRSEGPGIVYCRSDSDAERVWGEAKAAGRSSPLCIVDGHTSGPAVIAGETLREVLAHVEAHGRRIHDPHPPGYVYRDDGSHVWRPPSPHQRHSS